LQWEKKKEGAMVGAQSHPSSNSLRKRKLASLGQLTAGIAHEIKESSELCE